ncbi:MAG TPA: hypothetical protein VIJ16_07465 [Gemmatimonadaceae bacterium]
MTGTHEKIGAGQPSHRTSEMRAVFGERNEVGLAATTEPRAHSFGYAGPPLRGGGIEHHFDRITDGELFHRANVAPYLVLLPKNGAEHEDQWGQ